MTEDFKIPPVFNRGAYLNALREFPAVQGLGLHTSTAAGPGSIPGPGTKIPQAVQSSQKIKK